MVRSFVVRGYPKRVAKFPYDLRRYEQGGLSVTLYDRSGAARSYTIDEIQSMFESGATPAGAAYNPARRRKLSPAQVDEIRSLLLMGHAVSYIADRFGISEGAVRDIRDGRTWRDSAER